MTTACSPFAGVAAVCSPFVDVAAACSPFSWRQRRCRGVDVTALSLALQQCATPFPGVAVGLALQPYLLALHRCCVAGLSLVLQRCCSGVQPFAGVAALWLTLPRRCVAALSLELQRRWCYSAFTGVAVACSPLQPFCRSAVLQPLRRC